MSFRKVSVASVTNGTRLQTDGRPIKIGGERREGQTSPRIYGHLARNNCINFA